jgi:4-hydroxybenzoate polyprenyltransferase
MRGTGEMGKIADLVFLIRPPLLCASATFFFAGALSAARHAGGIYALSRIMEVLPNLGLFGLVVAAAFVLNQIFDVESDRANKKAFLMPMGAVTRRQGVLVFAAVIASAVGLSFLFDRGVRYMAWLGLILGFLYSAPPVRLKGKAVLDMVANVAGFGVVGFAMGWLAYAGMGMPLWIRSSPYALAMAGIFLNTCIPDEAGDRLAGDRTSCVVFGRSAVARWALILTAAAAAVGILTGEMLCVLAVAASLPALVAVSAEPDPASSVVASQLAARSLLVLVCVKAPVFAVITVAVYVASRAYYRRRFGVGYPRMEGAVETARTSPL